MSNRATQRHSDRTWRKTDLRHGYTTSACAAACATAGLKALAAGQQVNQVTIDLPGKDNVTFEMVRCEITPEGVLTGTIKDSGDDPDVTHGTEIQTFVSWNQQPDIEIRGGLGVGTVTKPGLPVPVGEPAINPGPKRLIERIIQTAKTELAENRGLIIEIRVPKGAELALETLNPRLGIIGGISILGNTGILKPFSNSAYRASIYTELKVAQQNNAPKVVLTTGSRSEKYAMQLYPELPELAFIQVGDHMDFALKQCRRLKLRKIIISGMIGKISKLAQGRMQTHVSQGLVDFQFLSTIAKELGADQALCQKIESANTAHHVKQLMDKAKIKGLEDKLTQMAAEACCAYTGEIDELEILLFTIRGDLLTKINLEDSGCRSLYG